MIAAFIALAVASSAYPTPPRSQVDDAIRSFKSECLSNEGIAVGVRNWTERMSFVDNHRQTTLAIEAELSMAKKAVPFDVERYAKALKAANDDQYLRLSKSNEYEIKFLRDLPVADRARWAKRLARGYTPPANYCIEK